MASGVFFFSLLLSLTTARTPARPSPPSLRGPVERINVGHVAVFNCTTEGFFPREIKVIWSKDGRRIEEAQTKVLPERPLSISYRVKSTVEVRLSRGHMESWLSCQIEHSTLETPLQVDFPLGSILRVPPKVRLDASPPSPVQLNANVRVTCHVNDFYPDNVTVDLFTKSPPTIKGTVDFRTQHSDGTTSLRSYVEVMATKDRNMSEFFCFMKHGSKPYRRNMTLSIRTQLEESPLQYTILGIGLFLNKLGIVLLLLFLFRKNQH